MKRNQRVLSLILSLILIAGSAVTPTWAAEAALPDGSAAGSFIESETDNAIQYLVDKNIFGVELPASNVA